MRIGELAKRTGLTAYTLRYYERIGLLPHTHRDTSRQRDYDPSIVAWIEFLLRLKMTRMPLKQILLYARLREAGSSTDLSRADLLKGHRAAVKKHITQLQACLKILDHKIAGYENASRKKEPSHAERHTE